MKFASVLLAVATPSVLSTLVTVDTFAQYPGYNGVVNAKGVVGMNFEPHDGGFVTVGYALEGVDPACTAPKAGIANSCGIHIHEGFTCTDATKIGGHYYNTTHFPKSDPWASADYKVEEGTSARGTLKVTFGYDFSTTAGRALVVHDSTGARASCSILFPPAQVDLVDFQPYPGYTGPLQPRGVVSMSFVNDSTRMEFELVGVDQLCTTPKANTPNSCGIHIHEGTTCDDATKVGGHYFNSTIMSDPWVNSAFYQTDDGTSESHGDLQIFYGEPYETTLGRAFVLHDSAGVRVACALIKKR